MRLDARLYRSLLTVDSFASPFQSLTRVFENILMRLEARLQSLLLTVDSFASPFQSPTRAFEDILMRLSARLQRSTAYCKGYCLL